MSNSDQGSYDGEYAEYDEYDDTETKSQKRRSKAARNPAVVVLSFLMTLALAGAIGAALFVYIGQNQFNAPGPLAQVTSVLIAPGSGLAKIAKELEKNGVISDSLTFELGVRYHRKQKDLKAGEYSFVAGASMNDVMELVVQGKSLMHSITLPEGLTTFAMLSKIIADPVLEGKIENWPEEGQLLPDTYLFARGTSRQQLLDWIRAAQQSVVDEVWNGRVEGLPINSPEEMVILASIVEKETGKAEERAEVASVFVNRLRKGMRLQSDPTIIYGLFGWEGKPKGRPILKSDIRKKTAYNTYLIEGLPPGPIANPGKLALEAVANPAETDYLYFVADGTGGHAFAKNYDEHRKNVRNWRTVEKQRKDGLDTDALTELAEESGTPDDTTTATETPEAPTPPSCGDDCPEPPPSVPRPAPNR
jgi:UPF0755 protein